MTVNLNVANNAQTTLVNPITAESTSFVVEDVSLFPEPPFRVTIDAEIMEVGAINKATNTFSSITRGVEGTTPAVHNQGSYVENRWTAGHYEQIVSKMVQLEEDTEDVSSEIESHTKDFVDHVKYAVDTGTANAKVVTLSPAPTSYVEGMGISFKNKTQNTGAVTINVNGLGTKSVLKSNGSAMTSGSLKANIVYTVRYNGTNFILQGEGGEYGNATAADVLAPKTIGTESGIVTGTMPNRTGHVTGQSISRSGTTLRIRPPQGHFPGTSDNSVQWNEPNWVPENIMKDVSLFGLAGTLEPKLFAEGLATSASNQGNYEYADGSGSGAGYLVTATGLTFKPTVILIISNFATDFTLYIGGYYDGYGTETAKKVSGYNGRNRPNTLVTNFKVGTQHVYVDNSGFSLPVDYPNSPTYQWFAWK